MHADPVEYKKSTIMPLASLSIPGYAATALVTRNGGKQEGFGILGYFASEKVRSRSNRHDQDSRNCTRLRGLFSPIADDVE
ncbi:hypothetical protein [Burkholderia reimsis]|uniref:hypothetical protein n=1 Tax=Burkholderia reimsis TaxID=2234132 RepID=UPI0010585970|nr:hypothetical protein [Burkholderia reimsis]